MSSLSGNDLYSRVAARTGVPRHVVKALCFAASYDGVKRTQESLEDLCVNMVLTAKSITITNAQAHKAQAQQERK